DIAISGRPSMILSTGLSFFGRNGCPVGISHPWYAFLFFFAPFFEGEPFSIEDSSQIDQFPKNTGVISSRERASDIAEYLLADKGYDSDTSIEKAKWEE
ncbi:MAG: hypothetical protein IJY48_06390, partial [Mailhella sp.]|nr:hypothetical protein [Mailhella sp.]